MLKRLIGILCITSLFACNKKSPQEDLTTTYVIFEKVDAYINSIGHNNKLSTSPANGLYTIVFKADSSSVLINNDVFTRKGNYYQSSSSSAFNAQFYKDTVSVNKFIGVKEDVQQWLYFRAIKK